jgi:hypothetical protein
VKLASRGQRDLDTGPKPIPDAVERTALQRQARAVHIKSLLAAALLTLLLISL